MRRIREPWLGVGCLAVLLTVFATSSMAVVAQSHPAQRKSSLPVTQESKDIEAVRSELLELLRLSPKLTAVISADPTLLTDEVYVSRNNPELGEFLHSHPEVVRNPEFYLFLPPTVLGVGGRPVRDSQGFAGPPNDIRIQEKAITLLVLVLMLAALLWIFRIVLENIKWNRRSKMQSELYSRVLDKCGTNEELLASFRTSAGKPFFDLASIEPPTASPLSRIFLPLQFGIVLTLAGGGFLSIRASLPEHDARIFLGLGTLVFMVGLGLMISAAVSYFLARHLGLLPKPGKTNETSANTSSSN